MIYLSDLTLIQGSIYRVDGVHNMPFDETYGLGKTEEELNQTGLLVETLPVREDNGKNTTLFLNKSTKEMYYEYTDFPLTEEEKFEQLSNALGDALLENAADKVRIVELEKTQGELLMEVAMLKMGGNL